MADRLLDLLQFWGEPEDRDGKLTVWSTCVIDGQVFPGVDGLDNAGACICIPQAKVKYTSDRQKLQAKGGRRSVKEGYDPQPVQLSVLIWTIDQWRAFQSYLPKINPRLKENQQKSRAIEHPFLSALGISSVFIDEISTPKETGVPDVMEVSIAGFEVFSRPGTTVTKVIKASATDINTSEATPLASKFSLSGKPGE